MCGTGSFKIAAITAAMSSFDGGAFLPLPERHGHQAKLRDRLERCHVVIREPAGVYGHVIHPRHPCKQPIRQPCLAGVSGRMAGARQPLTHGHDDFQPPVLRGHRERRTGGQRVPQQWCAEVCALDVAKRFMHILEVMKVTDDNVCAQSSQCFAADVCTVNERADLETVREQLADGSRTGLAGSACDEDAWTSHCRSPGED